MRVTLVLSSRIADDSQLRSARVNKMLMSWNPKGHELL